MRIRLGQLSASMLKAQDFVVAVDPSNQSFYLPIHGQHSIPGYSPPGTPPRKLKPPFEVEIDSRSDADVNHLLALMLEARGASRYPSPVRDRVMAAYRCQFGTTAFALDKIRDQKRSTEA